MKSYEINQDEGTVTYFFDRDTAQSETMRLDDAFELLFWLKRHEDDLRQMLQKFVGMPVRQANGQGFPLRLINGYHVGLTGELARVKIKASRYQEVSSEVEQATRRSWLARQDERAKASGNFIRYKPGDNTGAVIDQSPTHEVYNMQDCPSDLVNEQVGKLKSPEYWQTFHMTDNLDSGKFAKLP